MAVASSSTAASESENILHPPDDSNITQRAWELHYYNVPEDEHFLPLWLRSITDHGIVFYDDASARYNENRYVEMLNEHIAIIRRSVWKDAQRCYRAEIEEEYRLAFDMLKDVRQYRREEGAPVLEYETPYPDNMSGRKLAVAELAHYNIHSDDRLPTRAVRYLKTFERIWRQVFVHYNSIFQMETKSMLKLREEMFRTLYKSEFERAFESELDRDVFRALHDPEMTKMTIGGHGECYDDDGMIRETAFIAATDALARSPYVNSVVLESKLKPVDRIARAFSGRETRESLKRLQEDAAVFLLTHTARALHRNRNIRSVEVRSMYMLGGELIMGQIRGQFTQIMIVLESLMLLEKCFMRGDVELKEAFEKGPLNESYPDHLRGVTWQERAINTLTASGETAKRKMADALFLAKNSVDRANRLPDGSSDRGVHFKSVALNELEVDDLDPYYNVNVPQSVESQFDPPTYVGNARETAFSAFLCEHRTAYRYESGDGGRAAPYAPLKKYKMGTEIEHVVLDLGLGEEPRSDLDAEEIRSVIRPNSRGKYDDYPSGLFTRLFYPFSLGLPGSSGIKTLTVYGHMSLGGRALFRPYATGVPIFAAETARSAVRAFFSRNVHTLTKVDVRMIANTALVRSSNIPNVTDNPHDFVCLLLECVLRNLHIEAVNIVSGFENRTSTVVKSMLLSRSPAMLHVWDLLKQRSRNLRTFRLDVFFRDMPKLNTSDRIAVLADLIGANRHLEKLEITVGVEGLYFGAYKAFVKNVLTHPTLKEAIVMFVSTSQDELAEDAWQIEQGDTESAVRVTAQGREIRADRSSAVLQLECLRAEANAWFRNNSNKVEAKFIAYVSENDMDVEHPAYHLDFTRHVTVPGIEEDVFVPEENIVGTESRSENSPAYNRPFYRQERDRIAAKRRALKATLDRINFLTEPHEMELADVEQQLNSAERTLRDVERERQFSEQELSEYEHADEHSRKMDALDEREKGLEERIQRLKQKRRDVKSRIEPLTQQYLEVWDKDARLREQDDLVLDIMTQIDTLAHTPPGGLYDSRESGLRTATENYQSILRELAEREGKVSRPQIIAPATGADVEENVFEYLRRRERRGGSKRRTRRKIVK